MNYVHKPICEGLCSVHLNGECVGHIGRGSLPATKDGVPRVQGKHWQVLGYEYCQFTKMEEAFEALCKMHHDLHQRRDQCEKISHLDGGYLVTIRARSKKISSAKLKEEVYTQVRNHRKELNRLKKLNRKTILSPLVMETSQKRRVHEQA